MDDLRRPDLRVVARILGVLCERSIQLRPTQLQQAARTNYSQFVRYLNVLSAREFVKVSEDGQGDRWIEVTPKGFEAYRFLLQALEGIVPGADRPLNPRG